MVNDDSSAGIIVLGFIVGFAMCGLSVWAERDLTSSTFGISRFEAAKLKESCEKSLPRDEKCVPKFTYEVK
jgi:hypothetical protein